MTRRWALQRRYGHMSPAALKPVEGFEPRFYSSDRGEPPHVHMYKAGRKEKFWLGPPVRHFKSKKKRVLFSTKELRRAKEIIEENWKDIYDRWRTFFSAA